jgi:hypothetical protein
VTTESTITVQYPDRGSINRIDAGRVIRPTDQGGHHERTITEARRRLVAGYIALEPHMDAVVHHTTISGDFACAGGSGG